MVVEIAIPTNGMRSVMAIEGSMTDYRLMSWVTGWRCLLNNHRARTPGIVVAWTIFKVLSGIAKVALR